MSGVLERRPCTVVPTPSDKELAVQASRALAGRHGKTTTGALRVKLQDGQELLLPQSAARLLGHLLTEMAQGNAVTLIPIHAELTTQEAADYLNVSRPYLISLLEGGHLLFHKVGSHRRIKFSDLEVFAAKRAVEAREKMDNLARQAQELDMGY